MMTDAEWSTLESYTRKRADDLGLKDWEITVKREPCDDEAFGQCALVPGRRSASITFAAKFRTLTADEQRSAVIHELLHCHFASLVHVVEVDLKEFQALTAREHEGIVAVASRQMELGVDGISEAIAHRFPVIAWHVPKTAKR